MKLARGEGGDSGEYISFIERDDRGARKHPNSRGNHLNNNNNNDNDDINVEMKRFRKFKMKKIL